MKKILVALGCFLFCVGCAQFTRSCASFRAETFGSDFLVVQFDMVGRPFNCWKVTRGVENETASDGIFWQDNMGHLVHISGWYNRVQVAGGDWAGAARLVGIDVARCGGGRYLEAQ